MDTLAITRLHTRFRTPTARARQRLLRLPPRLVDQALADAATAAGLFANEHVCVRRLALTARFDLREPDEHLLAQWAAALASELAEQIRAGRSAQVQRYGSLRAALLDLVVSSVAGDRRRAWAWRQLGFTVDASAATTVFAALLKHPEAIPPVLDAARRQGVLRRLVALLAAAEWTTLAAELLAIHDRPRAWAEVALLRASARGADSAAAAGPHTDPTGQGEHAWAGPHPAHLAHLVNRLLASPLGQAVHAAARGLDPERRAALAVFLAMGGAPARLSALGTAAPALLALVFQHLARPAAVSQQPPTPELGSPDQAAPPAERDAAETPPPAGDPQAIARPEGWTDHAGLLFLVHLLDAHIEAVLAATPTRPLAWSLHALARALLDLADDDPAALAFAGLAPDAEPPNARGTSRPVHPSEQAALDVIAGEIRSQLAEHVEERTLEEICARRGLVRADPGWFCVHLDLDSVDLAIRRAGLDLNPGHLPWLGVVMEFVYA